MRAGSLQIPDALLQALAEVLANGVIVFETCGNIQYANPAAEELLGAHPETLVGRNLLTLIPQVAGVADAGNLGGLDRISNLVTPRMDGVAVQLELFLSKIPTAAEPLFLAILFGAPVPKRTEESCRAADQEGHLIALTIDLVRDISHNLRTSLMPIIGFAELLQEERLSPTCREMVSAIERNAGLMLQSLDSLIAARSEPAATEPMPPKAVEAQHLVF